MLDKIITLLKESSVSIPNLLLQNYRILSITDRELIILMILLNEKTSIYNPGKIGTILQIPLHEVLDNVNDLINKGLLKIEIRKVNKIREEHVLLDDFYKKLAFLIVKEEEKSIKKDIYSIFEKEFGRTLSPMEYEIITNWTERNYSEELILLALKEAVYNHVNSLSYVDRILQDWKRKGIKNKEDVEKEKTRFMKKKEEPKKISFEYDWLHEEENNS